MLKNRKLVLMLIVGSMVLSSYGCSDKEKTQRTKKSKDSIDLVSDEDNDDSENKNTYQGKDVLPDADLFLAYIKNDLNASAGNENERTYPISKWNRGIYFDSDGLMGCSVNVLRVDFPPETEMEPLARGNWNPPFKARRTITSPKSEREYELIRDITYVKLDNTDVDHGNHQTANGSTYSEYESTLRFTFVSFYQFKDSENASAFFKAYVDAQIGTGVQEAYKKEVDRWSGYSDKDLTEKVGGLWSGKKAEKRKVYSLEELPQDIYYLNDSQDQGHFMYSAEGRWANMNDLFKGKEVPERIDYHQIKEYYAVILDGDKVITLFAINDYLYDGCPTVYQKDWPVINFEEDTAMKSIIHEFDLSDPYKLKIDSDLQTELLFGQKPDGWLWYRLPELFI